MQSQNRKKFIIAAFVLLPFIISLVVFILINNRGPSPNPDEYYDVGSGETVSSPKNKTPELFGVEPGEPVYLGFSKLIDAGLTAGQLGLVKSIFGVFSLSDDRYITELSVTVNTIEQTIDDSGINVSFELTANRITQYQCVISYVGLDDVRVVITDKDDRQVFDSSIQ